MCCESGWGAGGRGRVRGAGGKIIRPDDVITVQRRQSSPWEDPNGLISRAPEADFLFCQKYLR